MENNEKKLRKIDNLSTQSSIERTSMMYDENHCGSCGCGSCGCGDDGCCSCGCCGSHNGSCGCGSEKCCSCECGSGCCESCNCSGYNNGTCGCDSCSCGVVIWGSSGTSGSSGGERIDYSQIQGSGYKGSPKGCADSAATGTAPDTFKDAKNPVNVMNNAFVRGRINMMWDEMTAKVKDNPGIELACCIFYDFDNKEYIGGKFINGTNGQVKLKDFTPQGNGYTGNSQNIKLVTVVHIHPALTYDKGYNARPLGPSPEDIQFVANKKEKQIDFGIVIDYKGKYEDYEDKNGEKTEDFIIRSGHPYDAPRQYHIFNDSRDVATGNF